MRKDLPPSQLTARSIRHAILTLQNRTDLPEEAKERGIAALKQALHRLHPSYSKMS